MQAFFAGAPMNLEQRTPILSRPSASAVRDSEKRKEKMTEKRGSKSKGPGRPLPVSRARAVREQAGLTLTEVSEATGISVASLSRIERGEQHTTLEDLDKLARNYGLSVTDLLPPGMVSPFHATVRLVPLIPLTFVENMRPSAYGRLADEWGGTTVQAATTAARAFAVRLEGESLSRVVPAGSLVIVDPDETAPVENGLYLVRIDGHLHAREFHKNPDRYVTNSYVLREELFVTGSVVPEVLGRIVASQRDLTAQDQGSKPTSAE